MLYVEPLDCSEGTPVPELRSEPRPVRMASIVAHSAMGERDRAGAAVKALMDGVTMP